MHGTDVFGKPWAMDNCGPHAHRTSCCNTHKARLLSDASGALMADFGISASNNTAPTVLTFVENTDDVHNVIVCTLCSCYPRSILGLSPSWYKSRSYRARSVREPRKVLTEDFGLNLPLATAVRVAACTPTPGSGHL